MKTTIKRGPGALFLVSLCTGMSMACGGVEESSPEFETTFDETGSELGFGQPICWQPRIGSSVSPCLDWRRDYLDNLGNEITMNPRLVCNPCTEPGDVDMTRPYFDRLYTGLIPAGMRIIYRIEQPFAGTPEPWMSMVFIPTNGNTYSIFFKLDASNKYTVSWPSPAGGMRVLVEPPFESYTPPMQPIRLRQHITVQ